MESTCPGLWRRRDKLHPELPAQGRIGLPACSVTAWLLPGQGRSLWAARFIRVGPAMRRVAQAGCLCYSRVLSPKYVHVSLRSKWAVGKARILKPYVTDEQRSRRPIFIATLRAAASWLFFRVAPSLRIKSRYARRCRQSGSDRLEKQPTDRRRNIHVFRGQDTRLDSLSALAMDQAHISPSRRTQRLIHFPRRPIPPSGGQEVYA